MPKYNTFQSYHICGSIKTFLKNIILPLTVVLFYVLTAEIIYLCYTHWYFKICLHCVMDNSGSLIYILSYLKPAFQMYITFSLRRVIRRFGGSLALILPTFHLCLTSLQSPPHPASFSHDFSLLPDQFCFVLFFLFYIYVQSYSISLPVPGLSHFALYPLGSLILLQIRFLSS